jgi:hypothetical protein
MKTMNNFKMKNIIESTTTKKDSIKINGNVNNLELIDK